MRQSILRKNVAGFSHLLTYIDTYTLIVIYVHVYKMNINVFTIIKYTCTNLLAVKY